MNTSDSVIRGLIINRYASGNGVWLQGVNNRVEGNWIGLTSAGTAASGNGTGVRVSGSGNTVGGTTAAARNVISGNLGSGVIVENATSSGNVILGNFVGTNAAGTAAVPNQGIQSGVFILNAPGNTVGGTAAGAGNVISGNAQHALTLVGSTATGNQIQGNFIGTAANGTSPLANTGIGIDIVTAPGNTVGGAGNARNVVANNNNGMQIRTGADNNVVRNNLIASNGGTGIRIEDASGNRIGGVNPGEGNTIQNNGTGIVVFTATSARNSILGNSISGHTFLGIDIDSDGITANDPGDADVGPNGRQNFPVLTPGAGGVQGTLNSAPNGNFLIQFFGNTACDASGNGEGATFLGSTSVATDANGNATIPLFPAVAQFVTATATDAFENTSEFSACVAGAAAAIAQHLGAANPTTEGFTQFSGVSAPAAVVNDGGFDAWRLTGSAGTGFYGRTVNYAPGFAQGWRLTARLRVVSGTGWAYTGLNTSTDRPRFDVGVRVVGADAVVGLFDTASTTSLSYTLAGGANSWILLELVYDPATAQATLFVNGIERLTGYPGYGQFLENRGVLFGALDATANFNLVKFEIPATPVNPTLPTTSYAAWRAGAPAGLTTADFEQFSTGTTLNGTEYASLGLTMTQRDGDPMRVAAAGDGSFVSTGNVRSPTHVLTSSGIPGFPSGYDDTRSENYDFTFTTAMNSAGLWIGNLNPGFNTVTVQFLSEDGTVIGTLPITTLDSNLIVGNAGQFDNRLFVGINASTPVKRIRVVHSDGDADGIVIDDVVWSATGSNPSPTLTSLSPATGTAGGPGFTLTVNGSNFVPGAVVFWDGAARATTFVNSGQLQATIPAGDLAATGTVNVNVSNPGTAESSNGLPFTVTAGPGSTDCDRSGCQRARRQRGHY